MIVIAAAAISTHQAAGTLAASSEVNLAVLSQYGVLGVFAAMLVVFARISYKRETDRSDRLEEDNRRLNGLIQDRVIPAVTSATRAVEECVELLNAMQRERDMAASRRRAKEDPS